MSSHPLVSIIMPAFNVAAYVREAIESVRLQSFEDWELWIVDDGSDDETASIARDTANEDPRIQLICGSHLGAANARNQGLKKVRGRFIAFLDGDDLWERAFLERLVVFLDSSDLNCAGVFAWSTHINEKGESLHRYNRPLAGIYRQAEVLKQICPFGNGSSLLLRQSYVDKAGEFETSLVSGHDMEFWSRILAIQPNAYFLAVPELLVRYRYQRPLSLSSTRLRERMRSLSAINARYTRFLPRKTQFEIYFQQALHAGQRNLHQEALSFFIAAFRVQPARLVFRRLVKPVLGSIWREWAR